MVLNWLKQSFDKADRTRKSLYQPQDLSIQNQDTLTRCKLPGFLTGNAEIAVNSEKAITKKFNTVQAGKKAGVEGWIFEVVTGADRGRQYIATTAALKIGRKTDNHIYLKDPKVSRYHATVRIEGDRLFIKDLQSTNGTKVNNQAVIGEREMFSGEEIKIGDTVIQVEKITSKTSDAM